MWILEELSFDDGLYDELEDGENLNESVVAPIPPKAVTASAKKDPVKEYITSLSYEDCRGLLLEIVEGYGTVRTELQRRITLAKSDVKTLAAKAKVAVREATAYACCFYHWGDRDRSVYPDYSEARRFLERLLELKAYDELIALADYLTKRSVNQMLMSENDEGQIGHEAAICMEVIAKAVMHSDMSDVGKILWFRKLHAGDEYCFYEGIGGVWDAPNKVAKSAWSKVADELEKELLMQKDVSGGFSYEVRHLSGLLEKALRFSGRGAEIIDLKKKAIAKTGDYLSLVKELIAEGDMKEARKWCVRGLKEGDQGWEVAEKVSKELPEEAIMIWRGLIKANLGKVGNAHYDQIGKALKCMRPVMERQGKRREWDSLIFGLRQTEKSKRNLMKVLDEVERGRTCTKPIISSRR